MHYLKGNKRKVLIYLFVAAAVLLATRLIFFLKDGTSDLVEGILIKIIAMISLLIIFLIILPVHSNFKTFFKKYSELFLFSTFIVVIEFIFHFENNLEFTSVTPFSIGFLTSILVVIALLFRRKARFVYMLFVLIALPMYIIFQDIYFAIFSDFFSFKEIVNAKEGMEAGSGVIKIEWIHIVYFVLMVVTVYIYTKIKEFDPIRIRRGNLNILLVPVLLFVLVNMNAEYPVKTARLHMSDHYLYQSIYSNKKFVSRFGSANYFIRDIIAAVTPSGYNIKEYRKEIDEFFTNHPKEHVNNDFTGMYEGKNLIFIVAESFDDFAINENLTPNIYQLMNDGLSFTNHYTPVYPRTTCDSEVIYNTGIIPSIKDGATCYFFNENSYSSSIANRFDEAGYLTRAFHSNNKEFYTRYKVYDGFGYDEFYGQDELDLNENEKRHDSLFFEKSKDYIIPTNSQEPFFSFVLTLSGHSPYSTDKNLAIKSHYDLVDDLYGDSVSTEVKSYLAAQIEVDRLVGLTIEDLEDKGILDDTVIIFTSDHYPYTMTPNKYEEYTGVKATYQKQETTLIIWSNDTEHQEFDQLSSSFDILPTIANLFNLNVNYSHYVGNDLFDPQSTPVVMFKDYSWYDGENYVLYGKLKEGSADQEYVDMMTEKVDEYFELSKKILRSDYFKVK